MAFPKPEPGLVISYSYVWRHEHEVGQEEGRKNRPCVIVLSIENREENTMVMVAPITHRKPQGDAVGVEIPLPVKEHLGLDHEKSWVICSEVNQFVWPGYDLRTVPGTKHQFDYGFLPPKLFERLQSTIIELSKQRRTIITSRD